MRRFYINSNGRLKRQDSTVYFETENEDGKIQKKAIPINDIDALYVFGEVDINTRFLNLIAKNDIVLHVFNYYGFYSGSFIPRKKNVSGIVLVEQSRFFLNNESRLYLASCFIDSSVFHIMRNLRKYNIDNEKIKEIEGLLTSRILQANTIQSLMSAEGMVRQKYYALFNQIIGNSDFYFEKRVKQPPDNPINAMISFGNSLMYNSVLTEILRTQLDPTISYLHAPEEKRFSLSLDIAEIFKPFIVDPLIFSLINKKVITIKDFDKDVNFAYLNEEGRKKFIDAYDKKIETTIKHRTLNRNVSYKYLIRLECYKLIKHLISDEVYKPFKAWW